MTKLVKYLDSDSKGLWARLKMSNGDPCWISVAQSGVSIKKSRIGVVGKSIYHGKNISECAQKAITLTELYPVDLTPAELENPVLKAFVNTAMHCPSAMRLERTIKEAEISLQELERSNEVPQIDPVASENQVEASNFRKIIEDYGFIMEHEMPPALCVGDVSRLPYPKQLIKESILNGLSEIGATRDTDSQQLVEALKTGYLALSSWQEGVGPEYCGIDLSAIDNSITVQEQANVIASRGKEMDKWTNIKIQEEAQLKNELEELGFL